MKIDALLKKIVKKRNRIISLLTQYYSKLRLYLKVLALYILAVPANFLDKKSLGILEKTSVSIKSNASDLTINCMGVIDMSNTDHYKEDIASISELLNNADFSLASSMNDAASSFTKETTQMLEQFGINVLPSASLIHDRMFISDIGKIAVITYQRSQTAASRKDIKLLLMRHILRMQKEKADYIIVFVNNCIFEDSINHSETYLYKMLAKMGADYIVGVTPHRRDGGTTYKKHNGDISRCVYSLGSFLTNDKNSSNKRVVLRLKLRRVQGELKLFEETFFPYYHIANFGFESLLCNNSDKLTEKERRKYLGETESEMRRIRPADRILTLGKAMELINTPLPEEYKYMSDFSVGQVCSRSFEVMPGDIFFFREPFNDANDLSPLKPKRRMRIAKTAAKRGAMLLISYQKLPFNCNYVVCSNAMEAHITLCAYLREQFDITTIGITGSIGKTSTKDMLAEVMSMHCNTVKSERNTNVQVKIGMNLQGLNRSCEVYIQEIGGGRPGGASRHSRMIKPEITVVTNIGDAHIGNFGSKEKLMENKLGVTDGMSENGVLFLNGDDPLLKNAKPACKTVFFAIHNKNADFYAENIIEKNAGSYFDIVHNNRHIPVKLNVLGEYNILNAVCCYAIGTQLGIPEEEILTGLTHFRTSGIRQNLVEVCGRKFFMDCYNASSESVKSALEALTKIEVEPGKKKIAVIGDITGMGNLTEQTHREIGKTLSHYNVDHILLFGNDIKYTFAELKKAGIDAYYITEREELNRTLRELIDVGDVAMFKGSSKMLLEYSVDMVFGTRMTDQRLLDEVEYRRVKRHHISYNLFADYATVSKYTPTHAGERKVHIPDNIGSVKVVNIDRAFAGRNISEILIPDTVRNISAEAFMDCVQLTDIKLPGQLKFIDKRVFKNCRQLRQLNLPNGLMHIGKAAFAGCTNLQRLYIPESVVQIGDRAFIGCEKCEFICKKGSYAEKYLRSNGITPIVQ